MSGGNYFLRVMRPMSSDAKFNPMVKMGGGENGGWVNVVMQNAVICLFKSVETLTGAHALTFSVYAVDASYCGSASFWVIRCHFLGVS
jgi:hypothetical protein